jgi:endonuclease/exonuclease/phosphatase family metal-dependent hydrolase
VTSKILQQLVAEPFVQERYYVSDIDGRTFSASYGTVLLIDNRLRISHLNLINFPQSTMGRYLLFGEIRLDRNEILRIGTVHLESMNNKQERSNQLNICQNVLNRYPGTSILMGDFNFSADGQENTDQFNALPGWIDVWVKLIGVHNPGYTFDTTINSMKRRTTTDQSRYDRIILRSQTIRPTQIKMIGTKSIGKQGHINIFPSDHFGLTAVFEKKK